jgi:hydrogenase large subunit
VTRITIDPIPRIEGHLRIDCEVDGGKVTKAWSSGQMWRGIEFVLKGCDPRDAWILTQRICDVCTTAHAIASVRAVENALNLEVPINAQYIRNMIVAAHGVHDHIAHFYDVAAPDWVDFVSALKGDPEGAAKFGARLCDYKANSVPNIRSARDKLRTLVDSGNLGFFASGWGHSAMKLPPDVNLLATTHYMQSLKVQRIANKIVTILGSQTPHIQNLAVGGVSNAINPDSPLTLEQLYEIKTLIEQLGDFVHNAMMNDVAAVGALYADWTQYGAGVTNYLSVPDLPLDTKGMTFELPGGYIPAGDLSKYRAITSHQDVFFREGVKEAVKHSWYEYFGAAAALHPYDGQTNPKYDDFHDDGKYSWIKAPTFQGKRAQVGPLANVLCMYAAGHEPTKRHLTRLVEVASMVAGTQISLSALHSTIGRIAARAVRCAVLHETLQNQWQLLLDNIARGDTRTFNRPAFPKGEVRGFGCHEAPRGVLSHWAVIKDGKIANYQALVPSTWNAGPRDQNDEAGPCEAALIDNPVADANLPLEVLRTVHSFDPCVACAVRMVDAEKRPILQVKRPMLQVQAM